MKLDAACRAFAACANEMRGVTAMPPGIAVPSDGVLKTQLMQVFVPRDGAWWVEAFTMST